MDAPILTMEEREAINSGRWFSSLSPSLRHDILRCAQVRRFSDGELIATRGGPPEQWIACAKGAVRVSSTSLTGKQVTLTYVEPGIWFGDVAMFDGERRTHDVYAHGPTTIVAVSRADFQKILSQHSELYEALLQLQSRRIRLLFGQVEDLNTLPLRASGQTACPSGTQLWRSLCGGKRGNPHHLATGAGRVGPVAGRIPSTREPGTQDHGTRGRDSHRSGRSRGARPLCPAAHRGNLRPPLSATP